MNAVISLLQDERRRARDTAMRHRMSAESAILRAKEEDELAAGLEEFADQCDAALDALGQPQ